MNIVGCFTPTVAMQKQRSREGHVELQRSSLPLRLLQWPNGAEGLKNLIPSFIQQINICIVNNLSI